MNINIIIRIFMIGLVYVFYSCNNKQKDNKSTNYQLKIFKDTINEIFVKKSTSYTKEKIDSICRYYNTGKLKEIIVYKNGQIDGNHIAYYKDGVIEFLIPYKDGKIDGYVIENRTVENWNNNGKLEKTFRKRIVRIYRNGNFIKEIKQK